MDTRVSPEDVQWHIFVGDSPTPIEWLENAQWEHSGADGDDQRYIGKPASSSTTKSWTLSFDGDVATGDAALDEIAKGDKVRVLKTWKDDPTKVHFDGNGIVESYGVDDDASAEFTGFTISIKADGEPTVNKILNPPAMTA